MCGQRCGESEHTHPFPVWFWVCSWCRNPREFHDHCGASEIAMMAFARVLLGARARGKCWQGLDLRCWLELDQGPGLSGSLTNQVFLCSQPSSASGPGKQVLAASPLLLRALVRPRSHSMTIKMGHAVCLILPKSLVCTHGLTEDVFPVRWCSCQIRNHQLRSGA